MKRGFDAQFGERLKFLSPLDLGNSLVLIFIDLAFTSMASDLYLLEKGVRSLKYV
jgi:hypothetical protein